MAPKIKPGHGPGWTTYGPPEHERLAALVSQTLKSFVEDCRHFAKLARIAKLDQLHQQFALSWEDFCRDQLRQPAEVVDAILVGVEVLGEEIPIPADLAVRVGRKAQQLAADPAVPPLAAHGELGKGRRPADSRSNAYGSTNASYLVRRLKRDFPEIAAALGRGEYRSARAAAIAAGIIVPPTWLDRLRHAWKRATAAERRQFLAQIQAEE